MTDEAIEKLVEVLGSADQERAEDVNRLADFDEDQLAYLDALGEEADPDTDGIEGRCV